MDIEYMLLFVTLTFSVSSSSRSSGERDSRKAQSGCFGAILGRFLESSLYSPFLIFAFNFSFTAWSTKRNVSESDAEWLDKVVFRVYFAIRCVLTHLAYESECL